jgi:AcrR family transcriptional regulator
LSVLVRPVHRSARKAKGDGHLRRAEILTAAERIFVRDGYEGATIRKIAEEVGVSSTALYVHFRDKAEMLFEICEGAFEQMNAANAAILAEQLDPAERVRRMLEAYLDFALANPNAYWLVFSKTPGQHMPAHHEEAAHSLGRSCYARFESAFGELAACGRLKVAPDVAAQAMWAGVHGLASLLTTKAGFGWAEIGALRAALLDGLLYGLVRR